MRIPESISNATWVKKSRMLDVLNVLSKVIGDALVSEFYLDENLIDVNKTAFKLIQPNENIINKVRHCRLKIKEFVEIDVFATDNFVYIQFESIKSMSSIKYLKSILDFSLDLNQYFFDQHQLLRASITRLGNLSCLLAHLPLCKMECYMLAENKPSIEEKYESTEKFVRYGHWDKVQENEDVIWVERGQKQIEHVSYLKYAYRGNWDLTRVVKPKLAKFYYPRSTPEEEEAITQPKKLLSVGYNAEHQRVIYSCYLEENEQIAPRELLALHMLKNEECFPDGRPIQEIIVIFFRHEMAERECRPLLDIGIKVQFYHPNGTIGELTN